MSLTLIMGPMKSGKSLELLARAEPYKYAQKKVVYLKPQRDVRTPTVASRLGIEAEAIETDNLIQAPEADVYAIDEVHMFPDITTLHAVKEWLSAGKEVIVSGLNTDHAGRLMPTTACLLELSPEVLINKQAVCEKCLSPATHTQVLDGQGQIIDRSLPPEVPDDGTCQYLAVCRECFI